MDGSNVGISFDEDGTLLLQSRGHYLRGGPREKQFEWLKQWSAARQEELFAVLGTRYVMYGESLFCKHTFFYDALPHYFMEFDVFDTERNVFLDTNARNTLLSTSTPGYPFYPVKVLAFGKFEKLDELKNMIVRSHFIAGDNATRIKNFEEACVNAGVRPIDALGHTDRSTLMEGLYVKWEEDGIVKGRYKFVRDTFTNAILEQEQHWHDRPIIQNKLIDGAFEKMFG